MMPLGPYPGEVLSVQGGDNGVGPSSQLSYTVDVALPGCNGRTFPGVTPQTWRWPDTLDTRGDLMVGRIVTCYIVGDTLVADFVEPPDVGDCSGSPPGDSAFFGLMSLSRDQLRAVLGKAGAVLT